MTRGKNWPAERARQRRERREKWADAPRVPRGPREVPGCTGKVRYASEEEARRYGDLSHTALHQGVPMHVYPCDGCGAWHLTKRVQTDPLAP